MAIVAYTPGNFPTYRFYVSTVAESKAFEVFPLNFNETTLTDQLQKGQVFYRRVFSGVLTFGGAGTVIDDDGATQSRNDDWLLFWSFEQTIPCTTLYLTITKEVEGAVETYWEGMFATNDGKFDIDNCTFSVTPLPNDEYTMLLNEMDFQYNILNATEVVTTQALLGVIDVTYTRNRWLARIGSNSVLEYLAEQVRAGVNVSSDFFTDDPNPVSLGDNLLLYLTIAQKSDIVRYDSSDPSTTAMMSWNELMDILWKMFQVKWDYDADTDTINVEHISWWTSAAGMDTRTQLLSVAANKYAYTKEVMPKYEKFTAMEADEINFVGVPIWYDSPCVNQDVETNVQESVVKVTTDLEYMIENPEAISDDGFVILCNYEDGGDYFVHVQVGELSPTIRLNMHLSWANLQNWYFRHNRVLIEGYMNNDEIDFWTALKTKRQDLPAITCEEFDPSKYITTELGETYFGGAKGYVEKSDLSPSGKLKLSLLYGPAGNEPEEIEEKKYIYVYEVATVGTESVFYAVASQPTASDVDLGIYITCVDAGDNTCDTNGGAFDYMTILNGNTTANITITWCTPVTAPLCIGVYHPDSSDATGKGWTVYWNYDSASRC